MGTITLLFLALTVVWLKTIGGSDFSYYYCLANFCSAYFLNIFPAPKSRFQSLIYFWLLAISIPVNKYEKSSSNCFFNSSLNLLLLRGKE